MIAKRPVAPNGVSASLKKAVDWKIFELQSMLVSDEVEVEVIDESVQWFQPHHYNEIVEERVTDGRCGYPLCMHHLSAAQTAAYRIDYAAKKVFSVETSKNFCSVECIEKAQLLERRYDTTVPYSRPAARKLDLSQPQQASGIDVILDLLGPSPSKKPTTDNVKQDDTKVDPPPAYTSSVLNNSGSVEIQFENGLPVPPAQPATVAKVTEPKEQSDGPSSPIKTTLRSVALEERSAELDKEGGDHEDMCEETTVPATQRPVYVPSPTATGAGGAKESTPSMAELFAQMNALRVKHNLDKVTPIPRPASSQPKASPVAGGNKFTNGSLLQPGATGSPVIQEKNANGAATTQVLPSAAAHGTAQPTAVRSGTMGRRPGPRTVKWGENTTQPVQTTDAAENAQPQSILKQAGIVEKPAQPVSATVKPGVGLSNKEPSPSLQKLRHGLVVERPNPTVMSEAAMLRKREVEDDSDASPSGRAPAAKAARGNGVTASGADEDLVERAGRLYIGGTGSKGRTEDNAMAEQDSDEGDHWVDVDPSELLMGTADPAAAMSIEGYVAQVKRTIRVSPATTIKNLSYSPFPPAPAKAPGAAAGAGRSRGQKRSGGEAGPEVQGGEEGYDDDASMSGDQADGEDDGEGEGDDVWVDDRGDAPEEEDWPSESEDEAGDGGPGLVDTTAEGAMADGRSLFLVLWSTLDELFAGSLANVFERGAPGQGQAQAMTQGADTAVAVTDLPPPAATRQGVASRPPIAMEQQSGQHAFLKLLQRGLSSAESQLDLMQHHIKLAEDRNVYQNVKRGLLSAAASALQTRSNLQHDGGVSAGAGLESAAWTLIGILVVDAIVQKCQIGPLGRAEKADAVVAANGSDVEALARSSAPPRTDVAKAMWGEVVEGAARGVLRNSERRRTMGRLRDGDLQILRSYFNYV